MLYTLTMMPNSKQTVIFEFFTQRLTDKKYCLERWNQTSKVFSFYATLQMEYDKNLLCITMAL